MDSTDKQLTTMYINEDDLLTVNTEGRNDLMKVVKDRRQDRNILIGETRDFVIIYDSEDNKDLFIGKWQTENKNLHIAQHLLSKWKDLYQSYEEELEALDYIKNNRLKGVKAGALKQRKL